MQHFKENKSLTLEKEGLTQAKVCVSGEHLESGKRKSLIRSLE